MGQENKHVDFYIRSYADTKEVKRAIRTLEKLSRAMEKANSLADELANKEINVEVTSTFQQKDRRLGNWLSRLLHRTRCRIVDKGYYNKSTKEGGRCRRRSTRRRRSDWTEQDSVRVSRSLI